MNSRGDRPSAGHDTMPPGAVEDYGVVLDPATLELDKSATDEARARRAGALPLIDRGPGFDEAEASWRRRQTAAD